MRNCTNTRLLRKMLIVLLLCSFIAGTFTACSDKKQSDGKTTFTVGFDAEFPPYGYKDESGEYVGFDLADVMVGNLSTSQSTGILKIWNFHLEA